MEPKLPLWLICLLSILLFSTSYLVLTQNGMGATSDSLQYEYAAKHFANHQTLKTIGEQPYVQWAPLYPIILSCQANKPRQLAKWLHLISMCLSLVLWIKLFAQLVPDKTVRLIFSLALAFSTELMSISVFVWSEALFMSLFTSLVYFLYQYSVGKSHWAWPSLFAFLMLAQRNAGFFLLVGLLLGLFIIHKQQQVKLGQIIKIGIIGSIGFIGWNSYTMLWLDNHPTQFDYPTGLNILENTQGLLHAIGLWIMPVSPVSFLIGGISLAAVVYFTLTRKTPNTFSIVLLGCLLSYLAVWLIVYSSAPDIQRFTSVVYPLFFLLLGFNFWLLVNRFNAYRKWLLLGGFLWLLYPSLRLGLHIFQHIQ